MPYFGMREFLSKLEREGELSKVATEVDVNYEVSAICRELCDAHGQALLFETLRGYKIPMAVNLLSTRKRYAMALETKPVDWVMATRAQPSKDTLIIPSTIGTPRDPSIPEGIRKLGLTSKMIIDATKPVEAQFPDTQLPPKEILDNVRREWRKYGIKLS